MQIQDLVPLAPLHTFSLQTHARRVISVESEQDLIQLFEEGVLNQPFLILGEGSNTIFLSSIEETILKITIQGIDSPKADGTPLLSQTSKMESVNSQSNVLVSAGAGVNWDEFVQWTIHHNLGGVENLSLIPGTCGAAPVQNIGAYGVELSDVFHSLTCFDIRTGEVKTMSKEECRFAYRDSVFKYPVEEGGLKGVMIILSITLALTPKIKYEPEVSYQGLMDELARQGADPQSVPDIMQVREAICAIRRYKLPDPKDVPNSGSFFKNPIISSELAEILLLRYPDLPYYKMDDKRVKIPAGWLIEQIGWKGKMSGAVGTWPKQALVLIQNGKATGQELNHFIERLQSSVRHTFNIELEPEVNLIGMETLPTHG